MVGIFWVVVVGLFWVVVVDGEFILSSGRWWWVYFGWWIFFGWWWVVGVVVGGGTVCNSPYVVLVS